MKRDRIFRLDDRGAVLITSLMFLTVLMLLGFASIIMSHIDVKVAGNERSSIAVQYAAEAGLSDAVNWLNSTAGQSELTTIAGIPTSPGPNGYTPTAANWTHDLTGSIPGYNYSIHMSFKSNSAGQGGSDPTQYPVWLYQKLYFYGNSSKAPQNKGYPVIVIDSTATGPNNSQCVIEEEISKNIIPIENAIKGAVTANGQVNATGNITVSGYDYDANGNQITGAGSINLPGVDSQTTVTNGGSAAIAGTYDGQNDPNTSNMVLTLAQAFGLAANDDAGMQAIIDMTKKYPPVDPSNPSLTDPGPSATDLNAGGIFYVQHPYASSQLNGTGLLLVHNPNYIPGKWIVSCPKLADGTDNPNYKNAKNIPTIDLATYYDGKLDSSNTAVNGGTPPYYDAAYATSCAPYNAGNLNGGTFKGVIIADSVNAINGNINVYGAVISLSSLDVSHFGAGTAQILYSPDAISKYVTDSASINYKLSWKKKTAYQ